MKLAVKKQKQRYEYIFHQNTPEELDTNPDELSVEYEELKRLWSENCVDIQQILIINFTLVVE